MCFHTDVFQNDSLRSDVGSRTKRKNIGVIKLGAGLRFDLSLIRGTNRETGQAWYIGGLAVLLPQKSKKACKTRRSPRQAHSARADGVVVVVVVDGFDVSICYLYPPKNDDTFNGNTHDLSWGMPSCLSSVPSASNAQTIVSSAFGEARRESGLSSREKEMKSMRSESGGKVARMDSFNTSPSDP